MFDDLRIFGNTERKIVLQTRLGTDIKNAIDPAPTAQQVAKFNRLIAARPRWTLRRGPVGGYNCVGHVWASRRTGVFDDLESQIDRIMQDDGFRTTEVCVPGDLVAYWQKLENGGRRFVHVGEVVELRSMLGTDVKIPWVLSKVDATSGEVLHHFRDVACDFDTIEFWTDRT